MEQPQIPMCFKVVLVGDGGVGKSTYVNRLKTGEFKRKYIPTQGVDVIPLTFSTNYGTIIFKVWDCAGQEKFEGLRDGYWIGAQAALFMFNVTNQSTFEKLPTWMKDVHRVTNEIPFVICGNKCEIGNYRQVTNQQINHILGGKNLTNDPSDSKYFDISARSNYNFEKPWVSLARQLTGYGDLIIL
ncbi:MAG TPA: GTP-binding protein [Candidatus Saccharimonadales bacterium]|nr:GTP-binding protein [Candidatus Saccharimonadales bacterium]